MLNFFVPFLLGSPGSRFIYKAFPQKREKDTEGVWYKFERVNNPIYFLGIKIKDNFSVKKTQLEHEKDIKKVKYLDVRDYLDTDTGNGG